MKLNVAEPGNQFDMWRDYFGLAELVQADKLRNETEPIDIAEKTGPKVAERKEERTKLKLSFAQLPHRRPRCTVLQHV